MRIERFTGDGLHGYLAFHLKFNKDITFLTGINGSGKTTVINAVVALITPSLPMLANLDYRIIRIEFENDGTKGFIEAAKADEKISIRTSGEEQSYSYSQFVAEEQTPGREVRHEQEYYRELFAMNAQHPVLKFIASLPTPMFLGLDRRATIIDEDVLRRARYLAPNPKRTRNIFSGSLAGGLSDAAALVEGRIRDALIAAGRIGVELRRDLILQLLEVKANTEFGTLTAPSRTELNQIAAIRRDLADVSKILALPFREVTDRIRPFLDQLEKSAQDVPTGENIANMLRGLKPDDPKVQSLFFWSSNVAQLARIRIVSDIVASYNKKQSEMTSAITHYLELLNAFLKDSGKTISYDETGYISVKIAGLEKARSFTSLSSGEAQIFVILSHLSFNPAAQAANVFIIDEPELSLHVQWQELFVQSVQSANPSIQYVMATHSPSIILDKTDKCVDLAKRRRGHG